MVSAGHDRRSGGSREGLAWPVLLRHVRSRSADARDDCGRPQMNFSGEELVEGLLHFYFTKTVPMNHNSLGVTRVRVWPPKNGNSLVYARHRARFLQKFRPERDLLSFR